MASAGTRPSPRAPAFWARSCRSNDADRRPVVPSHCPGERPAEAVADHTRPPRDHVEPGEVLDSGDAVADRQRDVELLHLGERLREAGIVVPGDIAGGEPPNRSGAPTIAAAGQSLADAMEGADAEDLLDQHEAGTRATAYSRGAGRRCHRRRGQRRYVVAARIMPASRGARGLTRACAPDRPRLRPAGRLDRADADRAARRGTAAGRPRAARITSARACVIRHCFEPGDLVASTTRR